MKTTTKTKFKQAKIRKLPAIVGEWIDTTIGEQATLQRGIDITKAEQRVGTVPVISSGGVSSYHDTPAAAGPGVVLGRKGLVGSVYFISSDYWPHDTTLWVKDFHGNDPRFVYYFFRWMAPHIATMDVGSANPTLNRNHVHPISIHWPPLLEQRAIAYILGTLDDKIELNQRMNKIIEAISKSIFKHWFIDFEFPNEKGKPYKSSGGEMVYNEELAKDIPKGWETKPIDGIADFLNGLALQNYPPENETDVLAVIKIRELRQGISESTDKASSNIPKQYIVDNGDVLFSWSGSLEVVVWTSGKGALNQHLFKVTSVYFPKWFYYHWILRHLPEYRRIAEGKATTMGHIQRHHLKISSVLVPDEETLQRMDKIQGPIIEKLIQIGVESRNLSQIRDKLLPKLVSGKIRVPVEVR